MSWDMYPDSAIEYLLKEGPPVTEENCTVCDSKITIQIMKNSGVCSENCRKIRDGDPTIVHATVHAAEPLTRVNYKKIN